MKNKKAVIFYYSKKKIEKIKEEQEYIVVGRVLRYIRSETVTVDSLEEASQLANPEIGEKVLGVQWM